MKPLPYIVEFLDGGSRVFFAYTAGDALVQAEVAGRGSIPARKIMIVRPPLTQKDREHVRDERTMLGITDDRCRHTLKVRNSPELPPYARPPDVVLRCSLELGHDGDHHYNGD